MLKKIAKILLVIVILLVVFLIAAYIYLFPLDGIEHQVNEKLEDVIPEKLGLAVTVGEIQGDFFSGLTLLDVRATFTDSSGTRTLAYLPRIKAAYSLSNLWDKNYIFDFVQLDSTRIWLTMDSTGKLIIPGLGGSRSSNVVDSLTTQSQPAAGQSTLLQVTISELIANDMEVYIIRPTDTIAFTAINCRAAVSSGDDNYTADLENLSFHSSMAKLDVRSAAGKITYSNGYLVIQDLQIMEGGSRLKLRGGINLREKELTGQLSFSIDELDMSRLSALGGPNLSGLIDLNGEVFFIGSEFDGSVDIGGDFMIASFENLHTGFRFADGILTLDTLYGTILENCAIDGFGRINFVSQPEDYQLYLDLKNFNLNHLIHDTFESDINGELILKGRSFHNADLKLQADVDLKESSFDEYPLQKARGRIIITTDSITFADEFEIAYFENEFLVGGKVDYKNDMNLNVVADLSNLDRYRGKLFINEPSGRGHAEANISGRTADPDLSGWFASDSVWLYDIFSDSLYTTFTIDRFLTGRKGEVTTNMFAGSAYEIPYDTLHVHLNLDSNMVYFDSVTLNNASASLATKGSFDSESQPQQLTIDTLAMDFFGQPSFNRGPIQIAIDSVGFKIERAHIGNQETALAATGRFNYNQTLNIDLNLAEVRAAPWISLFEKDWNVDGIISGSAQISGSLYRPYFTIDGHADSLEYRDLYLGDLATHVSYSNRLLTIDSAVVRSIGGLYEATGLMHIDLALTTDSLDRFPDLPMDIAIDIRDTRFDLVTLLMPSVEQLDGELQSHFSLTGTPSNPVLKGGAFLRIDSLKYFDLKEMLYADSVYAVMENNRIVLNNAEIYTNKFRGKKRSAFIDGEIIVKTLDNFYYNLDVNIPREFPFTYDLDDITGKVEGELHIEGDTPPLVSGDLTILACRYEVNFAEPNQGSPVMTALTGEDTWDLDINIDILSNYWIKNDDIDAEFSGEVNLIRKDGRYRFIGPMEILRGRGFLFDKTFQLESGSTVTFEGNQTINPRLDIVAHTKISTTVASLTNENEKSYEQINLGVHITGTLENPEINPSEDSDVDNREDMLSLLATNSYSSGGAASSGFEQRLTGYLSTQVSQIGARRLGLNKLGVEVFEIDPTYEGQVDLAKTNVTLGFNTPVSGLYVYGKSSISSSAGQEVGFEYRVVRNVIVEGSRDEQELYRLLLTLRWEF